MVCPFPPPFLCHVEFRETGMLVVSVPVLFTVPHCLCSYCPGFACKSGGLLLTSLDCRLPCPRSLYCPTLSCSRTTFLVFVCVSIGAHLGSCRDLICI